MPVICPVSPRGEQVFCCKLSCRVISSITSAVARATLAHRDHYAVTKLNCEIAWALGPTSIACSPDRAVHAQAACRKIKPKVSESSVFTRVHAYYLAKRPSKATTKSQRDPIALKDRGSGKPARASPYSSSCGRVLLLAAGTAQPISEARARLARPTQPPSTLHPIETWAPCKASGHRCAEKACSHGLC